MAKKNPFKKESITTTLTNVAIGGVSNVAVDYAINAVAGSTVIDPMYLNAGKFVGGVVLGSMTSNPMLRAATDGIAVVGVSNLISSLMSTDTTTYTDETTSGFRRNMMGSIKPGHTAYVRKVKTKKVKAAGKPKSDQMSGAANPRIMS